MNITKAKARLWSKLGTRAVFGMALTDLAKEREDFYVVTADLAQSSGLSKFRASFPERLINVGIAEQNMIGIAGGLAKDGTTVFATSFAPFITMRAAEQVRMNMGYMGLNVKTVGLGAGLILAGLGNSHYGIEDGAVMRAIPGMTVISPADCGETVKAVQALVDYPRPVYLRLTGGPGNPAVYTDDYDFNIGRAIILREGGDVALVATGTTVHRSLVAADILAEEGISATVVNMHTLKPLDTDCLDELTNHKLIVTAEEHSIIGGLGSAVAEHFCSKRERPPQIMIGINDEFPHAGSYEYLLEQCGLTGEQIAERVKKELHK